MNFGNSSVTLLDTPGHIDFSAEMERTLNVLDYAVLVVSGVDGAQNHTETLWNLLKHHNIPTFIFINKMDISTKSSEELMDEICRKLNNSCISFSDNTDMENLAVFSNEMMKEFLDEGKISSENIATKVFKITEDERGGKIIHLRNITVFLLPLTVRNAKYKLLKNIYYNKRSKRKNHSQNTFGSDFFFKKY